MVPPFPLASIGFAKQWASQSEGSKILFGIKYVAAPLVGAGVNNFLPLLLPLFFWLYGLLENGLSRCIHHITGEIIPCEQ